MQYSNDDGMKSISGGTSDFKKIRDKDSYFVDKSGLIAEILDESKEAYLFTRPRRFGKSLNLSMLDAFFNLKYPKDNKWFDGLEISEREDLQVHRNAYPVIYLDLKVSYTEYDDIVRRLKEILGDAVKHHSYLLASELIEKSDRDRLQSVYDRKCDITECVSAMYVLTEALEIYHGKKTIILIDEYDNIPTNTYGTNDFQRIIKIIRELILSSTKGNDHLFFAVMTGVTQISKESIFSGSNHIKVYNIFNKKFSNRFGFTLDEVKQICEDFGNPEKFEEAKEWYDGYRFGDNDIFNPWSVLTYVEEGFKPGCYWVNTSNQNILRNMMMSTNDEITDAIDSLSKRNEVVHDISESMVFEDLVSVDPTSILTMLTMSGYLTAIKDNYTELYRLSIPNKEIGRVFAKEIVSNIKQAFNIILGFSNVLTRGDVNGITDMIEQMMDHFGYLALTDENSYRNILAALSILTLEPSSKDQYSDRYIVTAEKEEGDGRPDIFVRRTNGGTERCPNVIIEMKLAKGNDNDPEKLERLALGAIEQIKDRRYYRDLKGKTILYGIVMDGKVPTIRSEIMYL